MEDLFKLGITFAAIITIAMAATAYFASKMGKEKLFRFAIQKAIIGFATAIGLIIIAMLMNNMLKTVDEFFESKKPIEKPLEKKK